MEYFIIISPLLSMTALLWALLLMVNIKDYRLGFLAALTGFLALEQVLAAFPGFLPLGLIGHFLHLFLSLLSLASVVYVGNIIRDLNLLESSLKSSEVRNRAVFNTVVDGIVIIDKQGTVVDLNPASEEMFAYSREEVIGKNVKLLMPEPHQSSHDDYLSNYLNTGERKIIGIGRQVDGLRKDGTLFPVNLAVSEFTLSNGKHYFTGILHDLTELQKERNFVRTIIETAGALIVLLDREGRITSFNRGCQKATGYYPEEVLGKFVWDFLIPPEEISSVRQVFADLTRGEFPSTHTNYWLTRDGELRSIEWYNTFLNDERGEVEYIIGTGIDITDKRRTEDELEHKARDLERSNRDLQQFAYVASHDLQEPLRMISSYVQLLARRYKDKLDQDAREFIDFAVDGANRMQTLINDLLSYSRVGTHGGNFSKLNINAIVDEAIHNLEVTLTEKNGRVERANLPEIDGDKTQILQVFQNLITNGIKFHGKEPPLIKIDYEERDSEWYFSVMDNGVGFEPRFEEKIFIIFQRLHSIGEYPGTGIGLSICKRIIERHGGGIGATSQPGEGSIFYFTIPRNIIKKVGSNERD